MKASNTPAPSCPDGGRAGPSGRALYGSKSGKDTQVETPAKPYMGSKSWRRLVTLPGHPKSRGTNALTRAIKLLGHPKSNLEEGLLDQLKPRKPDQKVVILPKCALKRSEEHTSELQSP